MEHQTLGRWVVCPIDPATQRIILKIVGFLFSKLHHWGHANVCTVDWISVIVLGGTSLTVDLINLYDNNQFTIESCQIFPLLNEVTCKNFQGWGRWGGSMWLQLLENYKWVWTIGIVNLYDCNMGIQRTVQYSTFWAWLANILLALTLSILYLENHHLHQSKSQTMWHMSILKKCNFVHQLLMPPKIIYRVSHSKVGKVNWPWWGCTFK